jgi:hypothetical protein
MDIRISRENVAHWQKKGALAFRFETEGKDGVIISQGDKYTCVFSIGEPEKPARLGRMTRRKLILLARRIVREALQKKFKMIVVDFQDFKRIASHITFLAIARKVISPTLEMSDEELANY